MTRSKSVVHEWGGDRVGDGDRDGDENLSSLMIVKGNRVSYSLKCATQKLDEMEMGMGMEMVSYGSNDEVDADGKTLLLRNAFFGNVKRILI